MLIVLLSLREAVMLAGLFREKVKILDMTEIEKNRMRRLPGCMERTNLPFVK